MKTCNKCILNENYPTLTFNEEGVCGFCETMKVHKPIGEEFLLDIFERAKQRGMEYDALVPLSGGKDSVYILYLAVKVYKLKVMAMTYDNGFFHKTAMENINRALNVTGVKHVFYKPDPEIRRKVYSNIFRYTGDICGACDIGTRASILKASADYKTPIILLGTSPIEEDSFLPDSIQDVKRFRYILNKSGKLKRKEINEFAIYPRMNFVKQFIYTRMRHFGKEISPLNYLDNPNDKDMGEIIKKEMNWQDVNTSEFTKHFDCIAEPFTNYIRNKIYGYERRICQFSNMVRTGEITRDKALEMYAKDNINEKPENYNLIMDYLNITDEELPEVLKYKPLQYENHTSRLNKVFAVMKKVKDRVR